MDKKELLRRVQEVGYRHGEIIGSHKIYRWVKAHPFQSMGHAAFMTFVATFAGCNSDEPKVLGIAAGLILAQAIGAMVAVWRAKGL